MVFSGTVNSDFLKLGTIPENKKAGLIDYRATDFASLKEALLKYIQAVYPLDYSNFSESDLGVMLVELIAYMGAVMSYKADLLTAENYLSTAQNRNNVRKILEVIGVSMKGPVASNALGRLTLDSSAATVTLGPSDRVVTINSPEDDAAVTYTIYKTTNGDIDISDSTGSIELEASESVNGSGIIWENLVLIEGAFVVQTGDFSNTETIQTIELSEYPVIEKSIQVLVQGQAATSGTYTEVDNLFFASGASDKVFQRKYDDNYAATVIFGDNALGLSPSPDSTYTITYRIGGGTRGNLVNSYINVPKSLSVSSDAGSTTGGGIFENISVTTGGANAETVTHAKKYAPYTFKSQNRLVTGEDYAAFINTFTSTYGTMGKGTAVVRDAYSSANMIDVYILEKASNSQLQRASITFKKDLLRAIVDEERKMLTDEVTIVDGLIRTLDLIISVKIDKEKLAFENSIKLEIADVIQDFFSVDNFDFGKSLILSDLARAIFELEDVRFAEIENLDEDQHVDFNEIIQLNNFTINIVGV